MKQQKAGGELQRLRGYLLLRIGRLSVSTGLQLKALSVRLEALSRPETPLPLFTETMCMLPFALILFIIISWFRSHRVPTLLEGCLFCLGFVVIRFAVSKIVIFCKSKLGLDPAKSLIEPPLQTACLRIGKSLWMSSELWMKRSRESGSNIRLPIHGAIQRVAGNTLKYVGLFFLYGAFKGQIPAEFTVRSKTDTLKNPAE